MSLMRKIILFVAVIIIALVFINQYKNVSVFIQKNPSVVNSTVDVNEMNGTPEKVATVAENLETPWSLAFLPNNDIVFTERNGSLKLISGSNITTIEKISDVLEYGEGGLMGLAIHPNFSQNKYLYVMYTYQGEGNNTKNRVIRYKFNNNSLIERTIIIDNIPGAIYHNGGRIKFGPDGYLYVTTGDSLEPSLAQNTNSLAGKILRVTDDGRSAPGNPFNNLIYSYGHRNPQGITWDSSERLWETEHGRSSPSGYDEINVILAGRNYGWPQIQGPETRPGMESPLAQSGDETWAPGGAVFLGDSLFYTGLRGKALFELRIENGNALITKHFLDEFGRIRDVILGPDNLLYITTSNRDGRGTPSTGDDRILKIDPKQL